MHHYTNEIMDFAWWIHLSEDLRDCKLLNGIIYFITLDIKMLSDISKV